MGNVLSHLYNSALLNHTNASSELNIFFTGSDNSSSFDPAIWESSSGY